jgi:putative membrane protein
MRNKSAIALGVALVFFGTASLAFAKTDKEFLSDAIQGNLGEISIGELAQKNGKSEGVRSFGKMLVQDHSAADDKAVRLAKVHDLTPPTEPKAEAKQVHDKLAKLSGDDFDKEFAKAMVEDQKRILRNSRNRPRAAAM